MPERPENESTPPPAQSEGRRPSPEARNTSGPGARRAYDHRTPVLYVDADGQTRGALVTRWHPKAPGDDGEPLADLVTVGDDGGLERRPNVPHVSRVAKATGGEGGGEAWTGAFD